MARIRTIKPEMAQDEDLAGCSIEAQLLAARILCHCDDEGFFKANAMLVKASCFPLLDYPSSKVHGMLSELSRAGYLELLEGLDGKEYGVVTGFTKHQKVNRPSESKIKSKIKGIKPITEHSVNPHGEITSGKEQGTGNREQGNKNPSSEAGASDGDDEKNNPPPSVPDRKWADDDLRLAKWIWIGVQDAAPKTKPPNLDNWADTIRLMRERDGHTRREIAQVFKFANSDEFWKTNILSPSKLRDQFAKLDAKIRSAPHAKRNGTSAEKWEIDHDDTSWLTGAEGPGDSFAGEPDFSGVEGDLYRLEESD